MCSLPVTALRGGDVIKDENGTTWVVYKHEWLVISEDAANAMGGRFTLHQPAERVHQDALCEAIAQELCSDMRHDTAVTLLRHALAALRSEPKP